MPSLPHPRPPEEGDQASDPSAALEHDRPYYLDAARAYIRRAWGVTDPTTVTSIADDAVQQAWLDLQENPAFDPSRSARPWVRKHVLNAAREILRARRTDDGGHREVGVSARGPEGTLPDDEAFAQMAVGGAGQTPPDDDLYDRERIVAWVQDHTTAEEFALLQLVAQGYKGRWLADHVNLRRARPATVGALNTQIHRLKKRLGEGFLAATRMPDSP